MHIVVNKVRGRVLEETVLREVLLGRRFLPRNRHPLGLRGSLAGRCRGRLTRLRDRRHFLQWNVFNINPQELLLIVECINGGGE